MRLGSLGTGNWKERQLVGIGVAVLRVVETAQVSSVCLPAARSTLFIATYGTSVDIASHPPPLQYSSILWYFPLMSITLFLL